MNTKRMPTWYAGILKEKVNVIFDDKDKKTIAQLQDICRYFLFHTATLYEAAHELHISQSEVCLLIPMLEQTGLVETIGQRCCRISGEIDKVWRIDFSLLNKEPTPIANVLREVGHKSLIDSESGEINILASLKKERAI